jgi:ribose 1,5-bisphosphate isomerase
MQLLKENAAKIISLEIQGATNIALYAIDTFNEFIQRHADKPKVELWKLAREAEEILINTRHTEPTMRNGLLYIIGKVLQDKEKKIPHLNIAEMVNIYALEYKTKIKEAKQKIAEIGARRIPEGGRVMTHCHSSIVEAILIEAHKSGKKFEVVCTETRPKFQGRITATHLKEAGLQVHLVVDSAMRWVCKNLSVDIIFIGADAITSEGTVMNKIGSRLLALVAAEANIPFYVASPMLKYNVDTITGNIEKIERRDENEVWSDTQSLHMGLRPKEIEIYNPAFETVARKYIDAVITEGGLFPPDQIHLFFEKEYPFLTANETSNQKEFEGWDY